MKHRALIVTLAACTAQDEHDLAITDLTKALAIDPNSAQIYATRATAYHATREYQQAWQDVEKAQSLNLKLHRDFLNRLREASGKKE